MGFVPASWKNYLKTNVPARIFAKSEIVIAAYTFQTRMAIHNADLL